MSQNNICIGCGRTWKQIRDWSLYNNDKRVEIGNNLKNFKTNQKYYC